jgi:hypothetical protein
MSLTLGLFSTLDALTEDCEPLIAAATRHSFQLSRTWFEAVQEAAMPADASPLFVLCRNATRPIALFPLHQVGDRLEALSTPYTCLYQPLTAPDATNAELEAAGAAFGRFCAPWGAVRLEAMDAAWPGLLPLLQGLGSSGLVALRFDHFGNWHEDVAGLHWADYLAGRPGSLRATIHRRLRRLERDQELAADIICTPSRLDEGIAAYEAVYARSWKQPEPFPRFSDVLMRASVREDVLRLAILRQCGRPIAAQYWIVSGGKALVAKLAHDEAVKAISPGTMLTAVMVRHLLEQEAITELDFGRGDDAYKAQWAGRRRQRIGFVLANPRRPRGAGQILRHLLGRATGLLRGRQDRTAGRDLTAWGGTPPPQPALAEPEAGSTPQNIPAA